MAAAAPLDAAQDEISRLRAELETAQAALSEKDQAEKKLLKKIDLLHLSAEATEAELMEDLNSSRERAKKLEQALKLLDTERKIDSLKRRAQAALTLNRELTAVNVVEGDVPEEPIEAARQLYEQHVVPYLDSERSEAQVSWVSSHQVAEEVPQGGAHQPTEQRFFALSPSEKMWKYHIDWVYPDNLETRGVFERIFADLGVRGWFHGNQAIPGMEIDVQHQPELYAASFVVRTGAKDQPYWHTDFDWVLNAEEETNAPVAKQAYTLMTPLYSMGRYEDGHLLYKDIAGNEHVYKYKLGKAVCFGSGFEHATQPSKSTETKAFLCFTFGTDKLSEYWTKYLAPPNGPPLGSPSFTALVYEKWGIKDGTKTGYEEARTNKRSDSE